LIQYKCIGELIEKWKLEMEVQQMINLINDYLEILLIHQKVLQNKDNVKLRFVYEQKWVLDQRM